MFQYATLNVKLFNLKFSKLKSGIIKGTWVTLNFSSNTIDKSNGEANFMHKLLLTNTQVWRILKGFANVSSTSIKFSRTQLSKMIYFRGFLGFMDKMFGPEMSIALEVWGSVGSVKKDQSIANSLLDAGYSLDNNKINITPSSLLRCSEIMLTNNEIKDNMKVINSLESRRIALKGTTRKMGVSQLLVKRCYLNFLKGER